MGARAPAPDEVEAGQAVYGPAVLAAYDVLVLGFSCRFAWRCSRSRMLALYDRHVGTRHLDIGVGTGFFLDRCRWPVDDPHVTLLDLNAHSLRAASRRIERLRPHTVRANALEPLGLDDARFDSAAANFLLHCLPGDVAEKAATVARNVKPHLRPEGVLFGSTILGRGVRHNALGRVLLRAYNRKGIFSNLQDDPAGLEQGLRAVFDDVRVELAGTVALFEARG